MELLRTEVVAANAGQVVELIRNAGYQQDGQVIQFLAAPPDDRAHAVFVVQAQQVANLVGEDVYIVGAAAATVIYDAGREGFAALLVDGRAAGWQRLSPSVPGRAEGQEQPPSHFGEDEHGILAPRVAPPGSVFNDFRDAGDLVTFERALRSMSALG